MPSADLEVPSMVAEAYTLASELVSAIERSGDATALIGETTWSYSRLGSAAAAVSERLHDAGVVPGDPVCVMVSNEPADIANILGVWVTEAVAVPIHRTAADETRAQIVARTMSALIVGLGDEHSLTRTGHQPPERPELRGAALVVFTSGSTGLPKGVVVGHDQFAAKIANIDRMLHFGAGDRSLLVLNITFSFGMWFSLLTLLSGGTLIMRTRFDADTFVRDLRGLRINRVAMVPTMMRVLFGSAEHEAELASVSVDGDLRQILMGGESLGLALAGRIREVLDRPQLVDIYGLTETATCDFFAFDEDFKAAPGSIGRVAPDVKFRIQHSDADGVGELQIRSPFMMVGYLDDPELTAAAYDDGWFRTGDLAADAGEGRVMLRGRSKDVISRGGNKVTPAEIELAIGTHPDVAAALVAGVPDPTLGERISALVVPRADREVDEEGLRDHLRTRLEKYKQPDFIRVVRELPLGRTGKADRAAVRDMFTGRREDAT